MQKKYLFLFVIFIAALILTSTASAIEVCAEPNGMTQFLKNKYNESPMSFGVTETGSMLQVYQSPGGETWTLIVTKGTEVSCLVSSGKDWRQRIPMAAEPQAGQSDFGPTAASAQVACVDAQAYVDELLKDVPMGYLVATLTGEDLAIFMRGYNATAPRTTYSADRLYVIGSPYDTRMHVGVVAYKGCIVVKGLMTADLYQIFKRGEAYTVMPKPAAWSISYRELSGFNPSPRWFDFLPRGPEYTRRPTSSQVPTPPPRCNLEAERQVESILDSWALSDILETIRGPELEIFLRAFNASPPITNLQADAIVIISSEIDERYYRGVMVKDGCVVLDGRMKIETYHRFKKGQPLDTGRGA